MSAALVTVMLQVPELSPLVCVMVIWPKMSTLHAVDEPALYETPPVLMAHTGVICNLSLGNPFSVGDSVLNAP